MIPIERIILRSAIPGRTLALVVLAVSLPASHVAAPRPNVDVSGSNSFSEATDRVYTSVDGGTTWRSRPECLTAGDLR